MKAAKIAKEEEEKAKEKKPAYDPWYRPSEYEILESLKTRSKNPLYKYTYEALAGDGDPKRWVVRGPNSDCPEAIDFRPLLKDVKTLKKGSWCRTAELNGYRAHVRKENAKPVGSGSDYERMGIRDGDIGLEDAGLCRLEGLMGEYGVGEYDDLVRCEQRRVSKALYKAEKEDWGFLFTEGFLLFIPPATSSASDSTSKADAELFKMRQKLMNLFDVKLFLPATKEDAKARRFARRQYTDEESSKYFGPLKTGMRLPGQMWKSEGYFEDVAWDGYCKEYKWLLEDGKGWENGVDVWWDGLKGEEIEAAVKWAVGVILEKLEKLEECR